MYRALVQQSEDADAIGRSDVHFPIRDRGNDELIAAAKGIASSGSLRAVV